MKCRSCSSDLSISFADLNNSPPSNAYLNEKDLKKPEKYFPLLVRCCEKCFLVQTVDFVNREELFTEEYDYFSSFSKSWLEHAKRFALKMKDTFSLSEKSLVIEVAANDGYLLQYFQDNNIPCLGIEPTHSTANAARNKGINIIEDFFGTILANELVKDNKTADLLVANNVLAHVPDINDFVKGFAILLKENGVATFEFPHLLELIDNYQFDTIYHEHFSYLSLTSVNIIFEKNNLEIFDVEKLTTHGGSLRVYAKRKGSNAYEKNSRVKNLLDLEEERGLKDKKIYLDFKNNIDRLKNNFLSLLLQLKKDEKKICAYGAAAKGNTFLNYCGVKKDLIPYVIDRNTSKQNKYLPGSLIPIYDEAQLKQDKPDYIVILPWNLKSELVKQLAYVREWNCKFITYIPKLEIF